MQRHSRKPDLFTGESDVRITPDLKALKAQFAEQRARFAEEVYGNKEQQQQQQQASSSTNHSASERPVERSAKSRPKASVAAESTALGEIVKKHRPASTREAVDPRFSAMYGAFNKTNFGHAYKFIQEKEKEEQVARLARMRKLRLVIKHMTLEAKGDNLEEYGVLDEEEEVFEGEKDLLREMLLTPLDTLRAEHDTLKQQSNAFKSKAAEQASKERVVEARRRVMKAEVEAVKEGRKAKPFIPGRKDMRKAVEGHRFDYLESVGGVSGADKFIEKKRKKKTNIR